MDAYKRVLFGVDEHCSFLAGGTLQEALNAYIMKQH